jgi:hypothetical protein
VVRDYLHLELQTLYEPMLRAVRRSILNLLALLVQKYKY